MSCASRQPHAWSAVLDDAPESFSKACRGQRRARAGGCASGPGLVLPLVEGSGASLSRWSPGRTARRAIPRVLSFGAQNPIRKKRSAQRSLPKTLPQSASATRQAAPSHECAQRRPFTPSTRRRHRAPAKMGNAMNVSVISQVYQSNRQELLALKKKAEKDGKKTIHREGWEAAEVACSVDESDRDIHERLFTLYDKRGNDEVPSKPFLSGLATITNNTLEERIHIALEIWDEKGSGYLSQEDVQSCFVSMAKTCEYFGDDRMDFEQLEELVQSMFDTFDADLVDLKMKYRDRIADFAVHPIMEIYLGRQTMDG